MCFFFSFSLRSSSLVSSLCLSSLVSLRPPLLTPPSYDYTKGKLDALVDIVIESGAKLFVSAVGVPPRHIVDRLHKHGILYMNMIGHPKHVAKCLELGVDIICAQGGEGGGHTGDIPTTILIPEVVRRVRGHTSPLSGGPVLVVAAGGIYNGQLLAASLMMGAAAVWVGTRFILTDEAGAPESHKEAVRTAGFDDTIRTLIFTGRPLRVRKNPYIEHWETERQDEIKELTSQGKLPYEADLDKVMAGELSTLPTDLAAPSDTAAKKDAKDAKKDAKDGDDDDDDEVDLDDLMDQFRPFLMGQCAAVVNEKKSAKGVVDELVDDAAVCLAQGSKLVAKL